jgi:DNA-directed RNA polymerase specialized sigma24 family protein
VNDNLEVELEVARRVALGQARRKGLYGPVVEDLLSDAYLAAILLCEEWDPSFDVPRPVYVGMYCERRMIDLYRQRHGRSGCPWVEVPLDEEWDWPLPEVDVLDVTWILAQTSGRERYVCDRIMAGAYHREIASELGVSKTRVRQLIDKVRERCGITTSSTRKRVK